MLARRHTTLNLDMDLITAAQHVLGTTQVTETIHRALQDVVSRDRRRQLLQMGCGDLTPQGLEELRRNCYFEDAVFPQPV